ncbi:MAG: hypothetical protein MUE85_03625 [Microscillaceae bacterium]|jgi:energy-converting hydrogenase Eha subunit E|nr:hypothetical protein [Microscillaceae bacterium]
MKNDTITTMTSIVAAMIFLGLCGAIIGINWQKDTLKVALAAFSFVGFGFIFLVYLRRLIGK